MIRRWAMANIKERRRRAEEAARDRAIGIGNGKTADEQSKPVNKASKNVEAGCSLENVDIDIATKVS